MAHVGASPLPSAWRLALFTTAVLFLLRTSLASKVGFGDAEALYACYALHPQPAYLDHPALIGDIARLVGGGGAPSPGAAHRFTAFAATALPWLGVLAARAAGASWTGALRTFFALALVPEMSIGLFALTPDLPLAAAWLGALGCAALALRSEPSSRKALAGTVLAGLFSGLAVQAKASGALILFALAAAFLTRAGRRHLRAVGPFAGLGVALVLVSPLVAWESRRGYPLLVHRFVATQASAGFSLRNAGALVGGQLLYVTPPFLWAAFRSLRDAYDDREDPVSNLLWLAAVVPAVPLAALCLWSRVAEPHWLAPAYLSAALAASRTSAIGRTLSRASVITGFAALLLAWVCVATPVVPKLAGTRYVPRYDLVNDLYAWQVGLPVLENQIDVARSQSRQPVVVGPHWVICAQVHAGLGLETPVGCRTPIGDDFATWYPETEWAKNPTVFFVTDDRFDVDPRRALPDRDVVSVDAARVYRGGRVVRVIRIFRLDRAAVGSR
jgi:hypothetical protein